jgi:autophagy-related protein 2
MCTIILSEIYAHFDKTRPDVVVTSVRIRDCQVNILLHDGYDWFSTRHAIEEQVRAVRRRLEKIRRLLANGQVPEETVEEASATLFNSVYIGLPSNADEMEPGALIAAIDEELNDDFETTSQSSWQSLHARPNQPSQPKSQGTHIRGRKLTRSKSPRVEFSFSGLSTEIDQLLASEPLSLRVLVCVRDFEILDHIRTSTWRTFLTELKTDSRGNVRETGSNMVRAEFKLVRPVPGLPAEEARVRVRELFYSLSVGT